MSLYKNPKITLDNFKIVPDTISNSDLKNTITTNLEDENTYTEKENVYFAFIDVLGFKKTFDDNLGPVSDNKNVTSSFAEPFKNVFTYYFYLMSNAKFTDTENCYFGQTSDSLYFYTEIPEILAEFLKIFSYFSAYSMTKNVFFRGGIAKGNLFYKDKHQFYGESVIKAYLLESEIAKFPIILLDDNTFNDTNELLFQKIANDLIKSDKETGRHYINPFFYLYNKPDLNLKEITLNDIKPSSVKNQILKNQKKFEYDNHNYVKYNFLLKKFNEYCEKK